MLTIREVATPLHDAILNSQLQGAHPPAGYHYIGRTQSARRLLLTMRIYILTDTGRSASGRLPLTGRTQSLRRLLLTMRIYYNNPWTLGAHPSGRLPIGRTQSVKWLLLRTTWGSTLGSGLWCESVERALTFAQTTNQRPRAQAHNGFYRDLSLTDDWLICLSCDHTWCCHQVVGNIPFAP